MITLLLQILALSLLPAGAQEAQSLADVRALHLREVPGTTVEHFRLDLEPDAAPARSAAHLRPAPIGLVRWIRGPLPGVEGGWRTACEVLMFEERTRVLHTERLGPDLRELVFRELREEEGRTLYFAWTPDGRGASREAIGRDLRRTEFDMATNAALPLSLVELARRGELSTAEMSVFQPLSNEVAVLNASMSREAGARVLQLRRPSQLAAGRYEFEGQDLVSFRWQSGGPVATGISEVDFDRWAAAAAVAPEGQSKLLSAATR